LINKPDLAASMLSNTDPVKRSSRQKQEIKEALDVRIFI
jgi:hypothetical protein